MWHCLTTAALFQNNSDSMFDSVKFGVAVVMPKKDLQSLEKRSCITIMHGLTMIQPETEKEEKEVSEALMEEIGKTAHLEAFVPRYRKPGHSSLPEMIWAETGL